MSDVRPTSANRILETALDLFASQGYDATSVQAICDAAHITKPTLYHFYGSKEGVYNALIASALERLRRQPVRGTGRARTAGRAGEDWWCATCLRMPRPTRSCGVSSSSSVWSPAPRR